MKKNKKSLTSPKEPKKKPKEKPDSWRPCPSGYYWRKEHFQSSYKRKDGALVRGHKVSSGCCENPSKKDQIYQEELKKIADEYFAKLSGPPESSDLDFKSGNKYDSLIRGWTKFWNDVLQPKDVLDPNLVKALIASESGFVEDPKSNRKKARGLMQVTETSRKALGDNKGELSDHLVHVDKKNLTNPIFNIAAGTRWLFRKKYLASHKLGREATWDEAVAEYKSLLGDMIKNPKSVPELMKRFRKFYSRLKK